MCRSCLVDGVLGECLADLGRELDVVGQRNDLEIGQRLAELPQFVLVARREYELHRDTAWPTAATASAWAALRELVPAAASASRSSRCARDSGVRSAVA